MNAELLAAAQANGELVVGHKQGFCMVDSCTSGPNGSPTAKHKSCADNQTAFPSAGAIEYGSNLAGQFVQITGLRDGDFVLENQVNPISSAARI